METLFNRCLTIAVLMMATTARAADVNVAVAANFNAPMQTIAAAFAKDTAHKAILAVGSTGKFYAQIKNGAPFEIFLAADDETPARLEKEGLTLAGTRFTYATGRLVLWSKHADLIDPQAAILHRGKFERIAIADPKLAPYGRAAIETLSQLNLLEKLQPRFVQGENIAQTYQFVATQNAALGFVALSQVYRDGRIAEGSGWVVPAELHSPIRQDAALLLPGKDNPAAAALAAYLRSEKVRAMIGDYGYEP